MGGTESREEVKGVFKQESFLGMVFQMPCVVIVGTADFRSVEGRTEDGLGQDTTSDLRSCALLWVGWSVVGRDFRGLYALVGKWAEWPLRLSYCCSRTPEWRSRIYRVR